MEISTVVTEISLNFLPISQILDEMMLDYYFQHNESCQN